MKKICVFTVSLMLFLTGCTSFHWRGKNPDYTEKTFIADKPEKIKNIYLEEEDTPVEILVSEDDNIHVTYFDADDESEIYDITEDKGAVEIRKKSKSNFGIFIFGDESLSDDYKKVKLKLYLPHDYPGNADVKTLDGNITVDRVHVEALTINTNDGDISLNLPVIGVSLSCNTKDGNVDGILDGQMEDFTYTAVTDDGRSNLNSGGSGNKKIKIKTKDGDIDLSFSD